MLDAYLGTVMAEMSFVKKANTAKLEEIKTKYRESKNLPRKAKKKLRKQLNVEWDIFSFAETFLEDYPSFL
jgi:hypothetical protein